MFSNHALRDDADEGARPLSEGGMQQQLLVLSGHDYRSRRKAGIHFVTEAAAAYFKQRKFISIGYSHLSRFNGDQRIALDRLANIWAAEAGVECFLWKTAVHPVNVGGRLLEPISALPYRALARREAPVLDTAIRSSSTIMVESGLSPIFLDRIRQLAPSARLIYFCSDLLDTLGVHPVVDRVLKRNLANVDLIRVPAHAMLSAFADSGAATKVIPNGIATADLDRPMTSPYSDRRAICSVGSMLFDPSYFQVAADAYPEIDFHIIGSSCSHRAYLANVIMHPEMPYLATLPFIQYAAALVAPYRSSKSASYLSETSLKMLQAAYYGVPAICPDFAVGQRRRRFGYIPNNANSIIAATRDALSAGRQRPATDIIDWEAVARELFSDATVR